jgi:hypothetical protein
MKAFPLVEPRKHNAIPLVFLSIVLTVLIPTALGQPTIREFIFNGKTYMTMVHVNHQSEVGGRASFQFVRSPDSTLSLKNLLKGDFRVEKHPSCKPLYNAVLRATDAKPIEKWFCLNCGWAIVSEHTGNERNELEFQEATRGMGPSLTNQGENPSNSIQPNLMKSLVFGGDIKLVGKGFVGRVL